MTALPRASVSVDEFIAWANASPSVGSCSTAFGSQLALSPERVVHGDAIYGVARALDAAIARTGVQGRVNLSLRRAVVLEIHHRVRRFAPAR